MYLGFEEEIWTILAEPAVQSLFLATSEAIDGRKVALLDEAFGEALKSAPRSF
jgi:hypothetical protein